MVLILVIRMYWMFFPSCESFFPTQRRLQISMPCSGESWKILTFIRVFSRGVYQDNIMKKEVDGKETVAHLFEVSQLPHLDERHCTSSRETKNSYSCFLSRLFPCPVYNSTLSRRQTNTHHTSRRSRFIQSSTCSNGILLETKECQED